MTFAGSGSSSTAPDAGNSRGMVAATLCLLGWNLLAWAPECALLRYAQRHSPALAAPKQPSPQPAGDGGLGGRRWRLRSWAVYLRQPVAPAALALALLYFTGEPTPACPACPACLPACCPQGLTTARPAALALPLLILLPLF